MVDLSDIRLYGSYSQPALNGREFILRVMTNKSGGIEFRHKQLVDVFKQAIGWHGRAHWVEILDFERKTIVSRRRMARLWRAASGGYGTPSRQQPYTVRGPTLNPTNMSVFWGTNLVEALVYAVHWNDDWFDPYWVEVRGPNRGIVLSRCVVERLYYALARAQGRRIVEMLVRGPAFEVVDGKLAMRPASILEHRVLA